MQMTDTVEWIAAHAVVVWLGFLLLSLLAGDFAWRTTRRRRVALGELARPQALRRRTAALLLAALSLCFALLAQAVATRVSAGELAAFDTALATSLRAHVPVPALRVIAVLSHFGDLAFVAVAAATVLLVLLWRKHRRLAGIWSIALLGIVPLNSALKMLFQRARPLYDHGIIVEHSFSFPSGHAFGAMVFYGMLAYVLQRLLPARFHRPVFAVSVGMICVIGGSRVLLQVHYASDVLAGFASGGVWLVACITLGEYWRVDNAADTPPDGGAARS